MITTCWIIKSKKEMSWYIDVMSRDQIGLEIKTEKQMQVTKNEKVANGVVKSACLIKKANYTGIIMKSNNEIK